MITVLRNNSKILTHQERCLNSKLHRIKHDEHSQSQYIINENKANESVYSKRNTGVRRSDSGSKGIIFYCNLFQSIMIQNTNRDLQNLQVARVRESLNLLNTFFVRKRPR